MGTIKKPIFSATVAEYSSLAANVSTAISGRNIDDEFLNGQGSELKTKGDNIQTSLAADRSKDKTDILAELDSKRDDLFSTLKLFVRAYLKWNKKERALQAAKIYNIIKVHGFELNEKSYPEQSALLNSLLQDLEKEDLNTATIALNLQEIVTDLKETQTLFNVEYSESAVVEADKGELKAAGEIKREIHTIMKIVVDYLNAMCMSHEDVYGALGAEVADIIDATNTNVKLRRAN